MEALRGRVVRIAVLASATVLAALLAFPDVASATSAQFGRRSYRPGETAILNVTSSSAALTVQVFRVGREAAGPFSDPLIGGVAVTDPMRIRRRASPGPSPLELHVRFWQTGLYFARLRADDGVAYAPFVLRPLALGQERVAVVLPTNTWQAYNLRDADGDGIGDSWYASEAIKSVDMSRPFVDPGLPPHFTAYDLGFLRWLAATHRHVDFLSDDDLDAIRLPSRLPRLYDLIVFPGHHEYVTHREYDLIVAFRNSGGNLLFLSANNFFSQVVRRGDTLTRIAPWREQGRPEAALVGAQYYDWFRNIYPNGPYVVTNAAAAPWLFAGTNLGDGSAFGSFGIEIDVRTPSSPAGTAQIALARDIFGPDHSAEMTYYETPAGAKVFDAGVINFGGSALIPPMPTLLANLWRRLSPP